MAHINAEQRKQLYSQELAAYTLRQWQQVRQNLEKGSSPDLKTNRTPSSLSQESSSDGANKGVQATDYAHRSQRRTHDGENFRQQQHAIAQH
ncbi:hypothetical protein GLOTRDRAFT_113457 [Gloeophyllum trabeum ATCC 11539]|uniref:Uncharacterized protein n=1 Tax=Gloeophyllum trabeum (strain ATCC 11539 / FP-39264 / Madison 617) TaxID=670483 RepID=S7QN71_GLOTA|nr:uncharacterized protein GLOTRDRAFT_113457 [Gloeophyllum trabeum ATCC 11539]EPQ60963.1 hypothetical protein GLOTRDRAFT_113457 [Gloeophyllum trabeum ATCC 11539]